MSHTSAMAPACRWGIRAAICALLGIVFSGPLAVFVLSIVRPQPPWTDAETFARHYHWLQAAPYFGGFLLVFGFVAMMASLYELVSAAYRALATTALVFTAAFAALVLLNYVLQTTFVPNLARKDAAAYANVIAALSMVNPSSLAWAIEMWAYGFLGVGHLLMAPVFSREGLERTARILFIVNGVVSVIAALWTVVDADWMMTPSGMVAYAAWNLVVLAMVSVVLVVFRHRMATSRAA